MKFTECNKFVRLSVKESTLDAKYCASISKSFNMFESICGTMCCFGMLLGSRFDTDGVLFLEPDGSKISEWVVKIFLNFKSFRFLTKFWTIFNHVLNVISNEIFHLSFFRILPLLTH